MSPALAGLVPDAHPAQPIEPDTDEPDGLAAIDNVLDVWSVRRRDFRRQRIEAEDVRQEFIRHAEGLVASVIRPTFQAIAQRLKAWSGGGGIAERPMDAFHSLRLTLWMALDREDLYPYIRLNLDVVNRRFALWEGNMWERLTHAIGNGRRSSRVRG